jgi:hypothetical protein
MENNLNNLQPFYVGQKVVCIKSHSDLEYKKGEIYTIKGIAKNRCKCSLYLIDIGVTSINDRNYTTEYCYGCKTINKWQSIHWYLPSGFSPLQESVFPSLKLSKVIEKESQLVSMN